VIFRGCPSLGLWTVTSVEGTTATITKDSLAYFTRLDRLKLEGLFAQQV
jgi:hypothetical protein